jgi:hypothetical protein
MHRNIAIKLMLSSTLILVVGAFVDTYDTSNFFAEAKSGGLKQLPSETTDFPNDDPNAIEIHVTTAKKDIIGAYHVKGEIKNLGEDILSYVRVTAHFYDENNQTVGVTTCCYADPSDIEPTHTSTFDSFALKDDMSDKPKSFRLSFDWD